MAGNGETNGNLKAHREGYDGFIWWLKFGAIASAITVALVIFLITR
jgi:di/tricarboxylate transporter